MSVHTGSAARRLRNSCISAVLCLSLAACGGEGSFAQKFSNDFSNFWGKLTGQLIDFEFGADYLDKEDRCYAERKVLADHGAFFNARLVGQAATNALIVGLVAGIVTRDAQTVAIAAGVAAGATLAAAYLNKMQQDGASANDIFGQVSKDVKAENAKIDAVRNAFDGIKKCRRAEGKAIQRAYDRKEITRAAAEEQMGAVREKMEDDIKKFREIVAQIDNNSRNYAAAYNDMAADNGRRGLVVNDYKPKQKTPYTNTSGVAKKEAGTEAGSLKMSNKGKLSGLESDCKRNVRKRDDCFKQVETAEAELGGFDLDDA